MEITPGITHLWDKSFVYERTFFDNYNFNVFINVSLSRIYSYSFISQYYKTLIEHS
jgi:hypothetical protein